MAPPRDPAQEPLRQRYLKLRSVLYDRATGLPAFPVLIDRLRAWLDDRRRIGLLYLRVDGLDQVESLYGWQVLDRILRRVAATLNEARDHELSPESLAALDRVAGTGFLVFIGETKQHKEPQRDDMRAVADKLARRLRRQFKRKEFAGLNPALEFSVGHAWIALDSFKRFERQVYAAIEEASSYEEDRQRRRRAAWTDEARRIVEEAAVESLLQPIVKLDSREVVGYEALARGPEGSPLHSPRALFEWCGRAGVETALDRVCCAAAIRSAPALSRSGKLFVNALAPTMDSPEETVEDLLRWLDEAAFAPADLVVEFSERGADEDPDRFSRVLERLKREKIGVALDDVGTGYATQAILERTEPNYLKLDVSLVREIQTHLIKQDLLLSLTRIAGRIGAEVIGEGVETEEEARALLDAGTGLAQGYLFAAPGSAAAVVGKPIPGRET